MNLTCPNCNFFFFFFPMQSNLHCLHFNCLAMPSCFGSVEPWRRHLSLRTKFSSHQKELLLPSVTFCSENKATGLAEGNKTAFPTLRHLQNSHLSSETEGRCHRTKDIAVSGGPGTDREAKSQRKKDVSFFKYFL